MKCWAGWIISWNQDFWEKYQQPHTCRWYQFNGRKQRGTKEPLDEGGRGKRKNWLKFNIQKTKIMASSNILHGKQKGKKWKQWQTLFSWAPKSPWMVTAAMKLKDLFLKRKTRQRIKKQRHYFAAKIHIVKTMVFPVVMYGCERWTIRKAGCRRIDAFELWCWRQLLRVPWTARRSNQSILKEIIPEYSLEGLKLQSFGHLM